jgi:ribosomal-protein-alanine N-acetyltransferase
MIEADLEEVLAIETRSFPTPWSRENYLFELRSNPFARNWVLTRDDHVVAYACVWIVGAELKINNIAVLEAERGRGLGEALLRDILREGQAAGCTDAELEVRPSNATARRLYGRNGFREARRRRGYYRDTGEDAIVMVATMDASQPDGAERG